MAIFKNLATTIKKHYCMLTVFLSSTIKITEHVKLATAIKQCFTLLTHNEGITKMSYSADDIENRVISLAQKFPKDVLRELDGTALWLTTFTADERPEAGYFSPDTRPNRQGRTGIIGISRNINHLELSQSLLHEIGHALTYEIGTPICDCHGKDWQEMTKRIGGTASIYGVFPLLRQPQTLPAPDATTGFIGYVAFSVAKDEILITTDNKSVSVSISDNDNE